MKIDDLTAAQRSLLRQLDEAPRGEWVQLHGRDVTIALLLSRHGLVKIGLRGAYKSGRHVQITKDGRSLLSSSRSLMAPRTGLVEALLKKMTTQNRGNQP